MPTRKLVELDGEYGGWLEIDPVKLKRITTQFKNWLTTLDPEKDSFGFLSKDLPIVESVLNGTLSLPYRQANPHNWEIRESLLDWYLEIAAPFYNTLRGALHEAPQVIQKDGRFFAWTEFEDSSD